MSNYVCFSLERSTKTRDGAGRNTARAVLPKLFAQADDELCPVAMYKAYKRHRPDDMLGNGSRFYLQPLSNPKTDVWYSHGPVGKNKIGTFMSSLAARGNLKGRKVNHSTRKTFAQTLVQAGRPPTEVAHLGGWKSIQTINQYSTPSIEQKADASDILSTVMLPTSKRRNQLEIQAYNTDNQDIVLTDITPAVQYTNITLTSSKSVSSKVSKQNSNPFVVLCGANIFGGTFNINIVSGKRKFGEVSVESSQESN